MIEKTKTVFYCSHCKRHGLSRTAMEKHERHCTMNPARACRWMLYGDYGKREPSRRYGYDTTPHMMRRGIVRWVQMFAPRGYWDRDLSTEFITRLRDHALGCPACMLSAIRQAGVDRSYIQDGDRVWDYDKEVERYRDEERESWRHEERRAIEATFL